MEQASTRGFYGFNVNVYLSSLIVNHIIIKHWSLFIAQEETYLIIFYVAVFHTSVLSLYNNAYTHLGDGGRET